MKKLPYLAICLIALTAFSCTLEFDQITAEGTPGQGDNGYGLYFPTDMQTSFEVGENDAFISVPVYRHENGDRVAVQLKAEDESGIFTFPEVIRFDAGQTCSQILIGCNPSKMEYGRSYPMTLNIADLAEQSWWSAGSVSINAVKNYHYNWVKIADGNFFYNGFYYESFGLAEKAASLWHDEASGLYRIYPFGAFNTDTEGNPIVTEQGDVSFWASELIFSLAEDNSITVKPQKFGFVAEGTQGWMSDPAQWQGNNLYYNYYPQKYDGKGMYTFNLAYYPEGSTNGMYSSIVPEYFSLPGHEPVFATLSVSFKGSFESPYGDRYALFNISGNSFLDHYRYTIRRGTLDEDQIAAVADSLAAGSIIYDESDQTGEIQVPFCYGGDFTFVAVPFNGKLDAGKAASCIFAFEGSPKEIDSQYLRFLGCWDVSGTGDMMYGYYGYVDIEVSSHLTYEVRIVPDVVGESFLIYGMDYVKSNWEKYPAKAEYDKKTHRLEIATFSSYGKYDRTNYEVCHAGLYRASSKQLAYSLLNVEPYAVYAEFTGNDRKSFLMQSYDFTDENGQERKLDAIAYIRGRYKFTDNMPFSAHRTIKLPYTFTKNL